MITETTAVAFRQNLGEMLNQVQFRKDSIVITKDGRPVAALIDAKLFERIRQMQERFDALSARNYPAPRETRQSSLALSDRRKLLTNLPTKVTWPTH